jgi:hypothetical protein
VSHQEGTAATLDHAMEGRQDVVRYGSTNGRSDGQQGAWHPCSVSSREHWVVIANMDGAPETDATGRCHHQHGWMGGSNLVVMVVVVVGAASILGL